MEAYQDCTLCPRQCHIDRTKQPGYCGVFDQASVALTRLHMWEEPCISGTRGSGTVFFEGCNLHCVYCQNERISHGVRTSHSKTYDSRKLAEAYLKLQESGAHNINLVTATHFLPHIVASIPLARRQGLTIPVLYNCGGYESVESLKQLEGLIDIYLPDFKYADSKLAKKYSRAEDYPQVALAALEEMVRQQPKLLYQDDDLLSRGVIVRHLLLPGALSNSMKSLKLLHQQFGDRIMISIMNQYTPVYQGNQFPELRQPTNPEIYDLLVRYAEKLGITNAYIQEGGTVSESFIPDF